MTIEQHQKLWKQYGGKIPPRAVHKKQTADILALIFGCQNYGVMHFIHHEAPDVLHFDMTAFGYNIAN